jgi:pimeloyl-ACP methyl ester carboxylesterase
MKNLSYLISAIILLLPANIEARSVEFRLDTFDGVTSFGGQIDYPKNCKKKQYKTVLLIAGTGLYYRNTYLGVSGTKRDLVFKDMAERLNKRCLAVVRYDYRGVNCDLTNDDNIKKCLNEKVRKTVNAKTIIDDIQAVYDHMLSQAKVDKDQIVILAHSEGSLNTARLIDRSSIDPTGLVFIGGITESPKSLVRWQFVERSVDLAFALDTDGDGFLTNWEITLGYPGSFFDTNDLPLVNLLSPTGFWNRFGLQQYFALEFKVVRSATLVSPNGFPYKQNDVVFSSMAWWKKWFTDDEPVIEKLRGFEGKITYFNGTRDIQAPGQKQLNFLKNYSRQMNSIPEFNLVEGKGHLLSNHPLYGPIDVDILNRVIDSIEASFR